jgi:hypothetical protein
MPGTKDIATVANAVAPSGVAASYVEMIALLVLLTLRCREVLFEQ